MKAAVAAEPVAADGGTAWSADDIARELSRDLARKVADAMTAAGEDPHDPALFRERHAAVMTALGRSPAAAERAGRPAERDGASIPGAGSVSLFRHEFPPGPGRAGPAQAGGTRICALAGDGTVLGSIVSSALPDQPGPVLSGLAGPDGTANISEHAAAELLREAAETAWPCPQTARPGPQHRSLYLAAGFRPDGNDPAIVRRGAADPAEVCPGRSFTAPDDLARWLASRGFSRPAGSGWIFSRERRDGKSTVFFKHDGSARILDYSGTGRPRRLFAATVPAPEAGRRLPFVIDGIARLRAGRTAAGTGPEL